MIKINNITKPIKKVTIKELSEKVTRLEGIITNHITSITIQIDNIKNELNFLKENQPPKMMELFNKLYYLCEIFESLSESLSVL